METLEATALLFLVMFGGVPDSTVNKAVAPHVIMVSGIVETTRSVTAETSGYAIRLDKPVNAGIRQTCYIDIGRDCPDLEPFLKKRVTATGTISGKRCRASGGHLVMFLADIGEHKGR